ncbi:MAG: flagellar biosynthesis anti-sigma factor FlgM [Epulopiscium sp. Nuni2H_MBin003]|nr:MAG: flagellar biosynthesis anti-sigma factor FlgM [Epulopiscium sp. Nuni2H_MBin003]
MRIGSIDQVNQIYQTQMSTVKKTSSTQLKDDINISDEALVMGSAYKAVQDTEPVRMDRVEELKQQIQNGTYNVSAMDVSEKMLTQFNM